MWDKINHYLVDWDPKHFQIFAVVAVLAGAALLRGWIGKSKY